MSMEASLSESPAHDTGSDSGRHNGSYDQILEQQTFKSNAFLVCSKSLLGLPYFLESTNCVYLIEATFKDKFGFI